MKTNRRISVERPQSGVSGLSASETYDVVYAKIRAWVRFSSSMAITPDGSEVAADGSVRVGRPYELERGDVVRLIDDTRAYRVEAVDEIVSAGGKVAGYSALVIRDETLEA